LTFIETTLGRSYWQKCKGDLPSSLQFSALFRSYGVWWG